MLFVQLNFLSTETPSQVNVRVKLPDKSEADPNSFPTGIFIVIVPGELIVPEVFVLTVTPLGRVPVEHVTGILFNPLYA